MRSRLVLAAIGSVCGMGVLPCIVLGQEVERRVVMTSSRPSGAGAASRLSRELVERMTDRLGMDELQHEIAMELYREFSDSRQEMSDGVRASIEALRSEGNDGDFSNMINKMRALANSHRDRVREMEGVLLEDVRAMLSEEQHERWPEAERMYRRGVHLGSLTRSQARVDLDAMVYEEFPDAAEREDVRDTLEGWALQVDALIVERVRKSKAMEKDAAGFELETVVVGGQEDPYKALRSIDARIVSAGERAVRVLEGIMGDSSVEAAWLRRAFARVYRPTDGERRLEAAFELDDLSDEQREQLDAASGQHTRAVEPARTRWVRAESEREEENRLPPGVSVVISGQGPTPIAEARKAVRTLDTQLEERLAAILTPEQLNRLPQRADENAEEVFTPNSVEGRAARIGG